MTVVGEELDGPPLIPNGMVPNQPISSSRGSMFEPIDVAVSLMCNSTQLMRCTTADLAAALPACDVMPTDSEASITLPDGTCASPVFVANARTFEFDLCVIEEDDWIREAAYPALTEATLAAYNDAQATIEDLLRVPHVEYRSTNSAFQPDVAVGACRYTLWAHGARRAVLRCIEADQCPSLGLVQLEVRIISETSTDQPNHWRPHRQRSLKHA